MKKLEYQMPIIEVWALNVKDIITSSPNSGIVLPDDEW